MRDIVSIFGLQVHPPLGIWTYVEKDRQMATATGSNPVAVEKDGQLGLAKQRGMEREHLTSALVAKVLVQVPPIEFDTIEGQNGEWAVSYVPRVHSKPSNDFRPCQTRHSRSL